MNYKILELKKAKRKLSRQADKCFDITELDLINDAITEIDKKIVKEKELSAYNKSLVTKIKTKDVFKKNLELYKDFI